MNRGGKKMNITQLVVGFCCVSVKILRWFSISFFFFFLSERVRVTVWAGASLSLTCVREASKRQLPVN